MKELHVIFAVGTTEYAVPAADVAMMESWQEVTRVPGAPPWVAGLTQIRGEVIPVVDLRMRFGLAPIDASFDTRVVVVFEGERKVGLKVDRAREVIALDRARMAPPPEEMTRAGRHFVRAVIQDDGRLVMVLDSSHVLGEDGDGKPG